MKASLFCTARYLGMAPHDIWPLSGEYYSGDAAVRSMQTTFDQFRCADEFGFDWVTVAEHHYSAFSLTPNPMVMAGALSQIVRRAKIAVLGPTLPILNPVRVAEELAMLDTMSGGRLIAGMMRGTPNEYVTYNINPAESRERFAEALHLIRRAWTETRPFGWLGRFTSTARFRSGRGPYSSRTRRFTCPAPAPKPGSSRRATTSASASLSRPCRSRRAPCSTTAPAPAMRVGSP